MWILLVVFIPSLACAEVAVEIIPGLTHYGNHSSSVELIPGHRQYSGSVQGHVTEILPGIQQYNVRPTQPVQREQFLSPLIVPLESATRDSSPRDRYDAAK